MSNRRRQIVGSSFPFPVALAGSTESAEFQQFLDRISAPSTPYKNAYRTLINGLVTDGVWSLIDGLYVMAAADATTALVNLKQSSYGLTSSGTMNFTADFGYYSDGTSGYLDTGYTPSTSGGNFSTASGDGGSLAVYIQSITTDSTIRSDIISNGTTTSSLIQIRGSNGSCNAQIGGGGNNRTLPSTQGSLLLSRTSHTTDFFYRNEAQFGSLGNQAAFSIPDATIRLFGITGSFSNRVNSAAMFGGTLTTTQAVAYQARINAYMTALGRNVY